MNYRGIIIEESLQDKSVPQGIDIASTKVEDMGKAHQTPRLKQWTLHAVTVPESSISVVAEKISQSLEAEHAWYADIFRDKVFKVDRSKPEEYKPVVTYGRPLGIPEHQLDCSPDIEQWER